MIGGMLLHAVRRETLDCPNTRYKNVQSICFGDETAVPYGADPSFKPASLSFNPDLTELDMLAAYNCTSSFGSGAVCCVMGILACFRAMKALIVACLLHILTSGVDLWACVHTYNCDYGCVCSFMTLSIPQCQARSSTLHPTVSSTSIHATNHGASLLWTLQAIDQGFPYGLMSR